MKVITPGHLYELYNLESDTTQQLQFIEKTLAADGETFSVISPGTTNEEVLKVLIDRMNYLQTKAPCRENAIVITKLEESLMWLEKRTAGRMARGVEGTPKI